MLRFYADKFVSVLNMLHAIEFAIIGSGKSDALGEHSFTVRTQLSDFIKQLEAMQLQLTKRAALELFSAIDRSQKDAQSQHNLVMSRIQKTTERLRDELETKFFLHIDNQELFEQRLPLFGEDVTLAFPKAAYDISEAGKCLALDRATACVFHLMRVVEVGIARLGSALNIELNPKWGWQRLINDGLEPVVNALPEKTADEIHRKKMLQQARAHLHAIRLAWRNDTMHPKEQYVPSEAKEIFGHVETFIRHLVDHL
jgi:hypothetical protein